MAKVAHRFPEANTPEEDLANEPWFSVDPNDVFPEEFSTFLLGDPRVREVFMKRHSDWLWPDERMRALVESL